jgi:hypothetical protein
MDEIRYELIYSQDDSLNIDLLQKNIGNLERFSIRWLRLAWVYNKENNKLRVRVEY